MDILGSGSEFSFLPIALELSIASAIYLLLLLKPTPRNNTALSITYSSFKLIALATLFTSNLHLFGIPRIPFLGGLLLNEVVLLIWALRNQPMLASITIRSMYTRPILALRVLGELFTVFIVVGIAISALFLECNCNKERFDIFGQIIEACVTPNSLRVFREIVAPQVRGLSFVIAVTASVVSISGWKFLLLGFSNDVIGRQRDNLVVILADAPWKQMIRKVYSALTIFTNLLFLFSFFMPGIATCTDLSELEDSETDEEKFRYTMGPVSNSVLNAVLAISQMFVADVQLRLSAFQVAEEEEDEEKDHGRLGGGGVGGGIELRGKGDNSEDEEKKSETEGSGAHHEVANFMVRASSVLQRRATRVTMEQVRSEGRVSRSEERRSHL
eukprot:GFKZ01000536.1.p2 GENE.GFKZ01000536.1~~GFKZ01000536.1.p2  ORF type:complete len:386 (+),score=48.28 GFKZ01000536.1:323-1480(+)